MEKKAVIIIFLLLSTHIFVVNNMVFNNVAIMRKKSISDMERSKSNNIAKQNPERQKILLQNPMSNFLWFTDVEIKNNTFDTKRKAPVVNGINTHSISGILPPENGD